MNKPELRRSLLKLRRTMPATEWREKSDRICHHLHQHSLVQTSHTILAYFSFRQEPDLSSLVAQTEHRWGFPRTLGQSLAWHLWSPHTSPPLQSGTFGILEPHPDCPVLTPEEVDLILVPAIACDFQGFRLGYGGGFYDRLLSQPNWANKPTIGIIFETLRLPTLPHDPWDLPLNAVCTEAGIFDATPR
ncbi:MAG: 5-formyltetrahydrofolate cyclo-ligase [Elainellaceae cyanobacterium]